MSQTFLRSLCLGVATLVIAQAVASPLQAQEDPSMLKTGAELFGMATKPVEPQDFVKQTRRPVEDLNFIPAHEPRPIRPDKPKSAADVKALQAQLEATADRLAAAVPKTQAPAPAPAAPSKARQSKPKPIAR